MTKTQQRTRTSRRMTVAALAAAGLTASLAATPVVAEESHRVAEEPRRAAEDLRPGAMARIPAGAFVMGAPAAEPRTGAGSSRETQHPVTLTHDFLLQETQVTRAEWKRLMGPLPYAKANAHGDDRHPVAGVNWYEALFFLNARSAAEGREVCYELEGCEGLFGVNHGWAFRCETVRFKGLGCSGYRLPTEAEWEYAARAGTSTATYAGDLTLHGAPADPAFAKLQRGRGVMAEQLDAIAWYGGTTGRPGRFTCYSPDGSCKNRPVATKAPNAFGLYDMLGNGTEWVWDGFAADLGAAAVTDPQGTETGYREHGFLFRPRVYKSCAPEAVAVECRAAKRGSSASRDHDRTFRAARTVVRGDAGAGSSAAAVGSSAGSPRLVPAWGREEIERAAERYRQSLPERKAKQREIRKTRPSLSL